MQRVDGAHSLEMRTVVDVLRQRLEHSVDVVSHLLPAVDQLAVRIAENGAPGRGSEEQRAPANEGLVVPPGPRRYVLEQLGEQRRLAACPLQEGRGAPSFRGLRTRESGGGHLRHRVT